MKSHPNTWEMPGGGVEYGEKNHEALVREVKEEHGVEIEVLDLLEISDGIRSDIGQHWVAVAYTCNIVSGEPEIAEPDNIQAIGWYTLEEADKLNLSEGTRKYLEKIKKNYPVEDGGLPQNW
tara:strand:+ start:497 stop:862 length:366 start_codon:yes stop_codon:yes gene_type:complete